MLIDDKKLLIVKQEAAPGRSWSLPGGRAEAGETLGEAVIREVSEETGITTRVEKLLYLCDKTDSSPPTLHVTFLLEKISGDITMPTNEFDRNPISDVRFVEFSMLTGLGFSQKFVRLLENDFPGAGNYMGSKENIGL